MKINLQSNLPLNVPTVTVVKLSDIAVGNACQLAIGYKTDDKINQTQFNGLNETWLKAIVMQKGAAQDTVKVALINSNHIDNITTFQNDTPVVLLDCEINFTVNYKFDNKP